MFYYVMSLIKSVGTMHCVATFGSCSSWWHTVHVLTDSMGAMCLFLSLLNLSCFLFSFTWQLPMMDFTVSWGLVFECHFLWMPMMMSTCQWTVFFHGCHLTMWDIHAQCNIRALCQDEGWAGWLTWFHGFHELPKIRQRFLRLVVVNDDYITNEVDPFSMLWWYDVIFMSFIQCSSIIHRTATIRFPCSS